MISCDRVKNLLSAFIEDELTPDLKSEMNDHLNMCFECKQLFLNVKRLTEKLRLVQPHQTSSTFDQDLRNKIYSASKEGPKESRIPIQKLSYGFSGVAVIAALYFFVIADFSSAPNTAPDLRQTNTNSIIQNPVQPDPNKSLAGNPNKAKPATNDSLNARPENIDPNNIQLIDQ